MLLCLSDARQLVCCFMELFKHSCFCFQFSFLVVDVRFMYPICSYSLDELGDTQYWYLHLQKTSRGDFLMLNKDLDCVYMVGTPTREKKRLLASVIALNCCSLFLM